MSEENLQQKVNIATQPLDPADPARFSQLVETAKGCIQRELQNYFDATFGSKVNLKTEVPTIEKYSLGNEGPNSPIETFTRVITQHPDILEKMPLVAITGSSGQFLKLGLGTQFVDTTQRPARVKGTKKGPFTFVNGDKIAFRTKPSLNGPSVITTVVFTQKMLPNIGATTIQEVVAVTKAQALYVTPQITTYSDPVGVIRFLAVGPLAPNIYPNEIEVLPPPFSTQNAIDQLGLTVSVTDVCGDRPPGNRYQLSMNLTINLDIGTESENERMELTDLLLGFFSLTMEDRDFTFYGRTVFDDEFVQDAFGRQENYQVILKDQHSLTGEAEVPRQPGSGEQVDLIYINRISIPITIIDYVDRYVTALPNRGDQLNLLNSRSDADGLPAGDFAKSGVTS